MKVEYQLIELDNGWLLVGDGKQLIWFSTWRQAVAVSQLFADASSSFKGVPGYVRYVGKDGSNNLIAAYERRLTKWLQQCWPFHRSTVQT